MKIKIYVAFLTLFGLTLFAADSGGGASAKRKTRGNSLERVRDYLGECQCASQNLSKNFGVVLEGGSDTLQDREDEKRFNESLENAKCSKSPLKDETKLLKEYQFQLFKVFKELEKMGLLGKSKVPEFFRELGVEENQKYVSDMMKQIEELTKQRNKELDDLWS